MGGDGECAAEDFAEGDEGLGAEESQGLQALVDEVEEMLVVAGIHLDEHVVLTGGEVALHHFGYFFEFLYYFVEFVRLFEEDAYESAGVISECSGFDECARSFEDVCSLKFSDALMDGSS